jgi:hypothetical protein
VKEELYLELLDKVLDWVANEWGAGDISMEEIGYEGPLPEGCVSLEDVARWMFNKRVASIRLV